ncbi:ribosomal-processing cysteine protease Prp [Peribacillus sp. FSL H8-0477]|uniref:ribosomal-processing cysteine protease Prp n=1 Tax=Peribacillus sp. FSL H8-0477 TaxID=2921388 RepID=UPI0030F564D4
MIKITFDVAQGRIHSFTLSGHADFAKKGSDIVCAGVSAVTFGAVNAVMSLTDVKPEIKQSGQGGYLNCVIPEDISESSREKVQLLLDGMLVSLQTIERDYGKYMKIILRQ